MLGNFRPGTPFVQAIGRRICAERKARGISQDAAAKLLGVSGPYLSDIERGKKAPTLRILEGVGRWRGRSIEYLLFGEEEPAEAAQAVAEPTAPYPRRGLRLPIVGRAAADGEGRVAESPLAPAEWLEVPRDAALLRVDGDWMQPLALDGQHVLVSGEGMRNGDLVIVELTSGQRLFKRWWKHGDHVVLAGVPHGRPTEPIALPLSRIRSVRRVVGVLFCRETQ